jgi:plasmid replication initiation protein
MMKKKKVKKNTGMVLVRKSNDLIEARYKFDLWETRFFLSVIAKVRREDDDFMVYRIRYKDVADMFGLKSHRSYDLLREGAKKLMNKSFYVRYDEDGKPRETQYHILRRINYSLQEQGVREESQEYIDVKIEQEMKPFLLQLQRSFTTYDFQNITKLGTYSIRIYELLKQYENIGNRYLTFEELKRMMEFEKEYPLFGTFFQRIITPSVKEINKYTDLVIEDVEKVKEGRQVVGLHFHFHKKDKEQIPAPKNDTSKTKEKPLLGVQPELVVDKQEQEKPIKAEVVEFPQTEADRLFGLFFARVVENLGVTPMVFADLVKQYTEDQLNQAVRVTQRAKLNGAIKSNVSGFFVQALKGGYTDQKEVLDKKKQQEEIRQQETQKWMKELNDLQAERGKRLNDKIREIVTPNPNLTDEAILSLQYNSYTKQIVDKMVTKLNRPLEKEDYRQDETLRNLVMIAIVEQNKEAFSSIFEAFTPQIEQLQRKIKDKNQHQPSSAFNK